MAKGRKTGGRDIKPGQVLNPRGAGAHDPVIKKLRRLTSDELAHVATTLLKSKKEVIDQIADNPEASAIRVWIARIIQTGIDGGNDAKLETILNRLQGKVTDKVDLTVKRPYGDMSAEQIQAEIKELEELEKIKAEQAKKKTGNTSSEP